MEKPEFDRLEVDTGVVAVGSFRLSVDHPRFEDSGAIRHPVFVFPRTSCVIEHRDSRPFITDTCTVTYYNRGEQYLRRPNDPRGDVCEWFRVRDDVLREVMSRYDPAARDRAVERLFPFHRGRSDPESYFLQRTVVRHVLGSAHPDGLAIEEAVLVVLERILDRAPWPGTSASPRPEGKGGYTAEAVLEVLRSTFAQPLSLATLSRQTGISVYHMCREFKRTTGTTIARYRNQLRLRRGLELTADSAADLSSLAYRLGYSSHSHFTYAFRTSFGMTPSRYRKRPSGGRVRELARAVGQRVRTAT
jgi:AraC family transcriptional regulator